MKIYLYTEPGFCFPTRKSTRSQVDEKHMYRSLLIFLFIFACIVVFLFDP